MLVFEAPERDDLLVIEVKCVHVGKRRVRELIPLTRPNLEENSAHRWDENEHGDEDGWHRTQGGANNKVAKSAKSLHRPLLLKNGPNKRAKDNEADDCEWEHRCKEKAIPMVTDALDRKDVLNVEHNERERIEKRD